jgi:hypothetical protein
VLRSSTLFNVGLHTKVKVVPWGSCLKTAGAGLLLYCWFGQGGRRLLLGSAVFESCFCRKWSLVVCGLVWLWVLHCG